LAPLKENDMDEQEQVSLTDIEKAEITRRARELLRGWIDSLSAEESKAWMDAHIEDCDAEIDKLQREGADAEVVLQVAAPIIAENPNLLTIGDAMELLRKKKDRTLEEAVALDAFDQTKDKPGRTE
jgi:hypothetical protein